MFDETDSGDNFNSQQTFDGFRIYVVKTPSLAGGEDEHNDCLYNCLKECLGTSFHFKSPEQMKTYLKLNSDDMVHCQ